MSSGSARLARGGQGGFTLIELLTVVAILTVLLTLMLPALRMVRELARKTVCANTMRTLMQATAQYNSDNKGCFPDYPGFNSPLSALLWTGYGRGNMLVCPSGMFAPYQGAVPNGSGPFHAFIPGNNRNFSANHYATWGNPVRGTIDKVPFANSTLLFVEEEETTVDNEGWEVHCNGTNYFFFQNMIAARHLPRGANLSFVDSHVEFWQWKDSRTGVCLGKYPASLDQYSPGNPDLERLTRAECPPNFPF